MTVEVLYIAALAYAITSLVTLVIFGLDKRAAIRGKQRTPERRLHLLSFAGGWPGALIAMTLFRHKRRKLAFVWTVRAIAVSHIAVWATALSLWPR